MAYKYIFDPVAADEYMEAFKWYEKKSIIAADNLILAVQDAISAICADPYRHRNTYKTFRELTVKKYPYYLIYYINDVKKLVIITSLYHHKRNPKRKYNKLKKK